ncbi:retrotransposon protein, putative, ty1-copia subclass [Tanacetum coccineum]
MKNYVELERLGYVLPQDLAIGLILNGLTSDFTGFVRNYNMHNMGKTGEDKQVLYHLSYKNPKPSAKEHPAKDDTCHHFKEVGHCKRNHPAYLAGLIKKNKQVGTASSSDVFIIELYSFPTKSWVYDTSCVEAIGSFDIVLPNGLVICLDNCHYAPSITRGVVSVRRLVENGFDQCFMDFGISVSKNNVHYFNAIPDDELFDPCVSCLSGKMTRKSFLHRPERATDLLGIIHTDVCGLLRHVSRQGASYFITFTYDYSRYGYVYLLKHKHEIFETFKDYALESAICILNMVPTKKVDKTPYKLWYGKVPNLSYLKVWGCEALVKQDTPDKLQQRSFKSERTHRALDLLCLNVEAEEHSLGDLNEPTSYKAVMLDFESNKWIDAMNAEIQSMMGNGNHIPSLQSVKDYLGKCFAMKDLREAAFILGIKIYRDRSKRLIRLGQNAYMDKILKRYKMDNFKRGHILMQERLDLNKIQGASTPKEVKRMQNVPYALVMGSIMYAVIAC